MNYQSKFIGEMKQKIACVYMIENLVNCKKYIGQTVNFRKRQACHKCNYPNKNYHIYLSMRKYGYENFQYTILTRDHTINHDTLDFWECYFINLFDTLNRDKGYNNDSGGNVNKVFSKEKREKMSKALKGRIVSDESKQKMSKSQTGKKGPLSNSYGIIRSNETKEKCGLGSGLLYKEILKDGRPSYATIFAGKCATVNIEKYPIMGKQLIIMKRLCMENDMNFQPVLVRDMLNFVQKIDLKTIEQLG
jgi:group I intron endonuclease